MDREYDSYHHLRNAIGDLLIDRLADVKASHTRFPRALDIGSRYSLEGLATLRAKGGVESLLQMDSSQEVLDRTQTNHQDERLPAISQRLHPEDNIPLHEEEFQNFDLVTSNLALHWVNDLPTIFGQIKKALRPDGLALVSVFGGETLHELRDAFLVAEQEREARVSVRVSPLIGVADAGLSPFFFFFFFFFFLVYFSFLLTRLDAGSLLSRAQMTLTTVDVETIVVRYSDMFQLMDDLRGMGESSAAILHGTPLKRSTLFAAAAAYRSMYGEEDGTIPATFQVIFLTGWHPAGTQQQPKRRGSARLSLKDLDQVENIAQEEQFRHPHKTFSLSDLGEARRFDDGDEKDTKKKPKKNPPT